MKKTDIDEAFVKGSISSAIGRGAKRLAVSAGRELGMGSMDAVKAGQNARDKITDDFIGFATQQGWSKTRYTMAMMLAFVSQRYNWMPDDQTMLQLSDYAAATFKKNESFIRAATALMEAANEKKQVQDDYRLLMHLKEKGMLDKVVRAYHGENLNRDEVRAVGGVDVLQNALGALHRSNARPAAPTAAPTATTAAPTAGGDDAPDADGDDTAAVGGSFSASPADHRAKWQRLQRLLPGRNTVLNRKQMDNIATIVGRDMLRRGLMSPANTDDTDGESSGGSQQVDKRNPSIDSVAPGTGTIVSIPYFFRYLKEAGVSIVTVKELQIVGAKHHIDEVIDAAASSPNIGKDRLYLIAAAFSMSLRLKKEARKSDDTSYDSHNRYISCRLMAELFKQKGISAEITSKFNDIGDASTNVHDVARNLRSGLGEEHIKSIMACFIMSIQIMSMQERNAAMKSSEEEDAA